MADNGTLSQKQQRFIRALLTAKSIREAAGTARISERTAWRWLQDERVKAEAARLQDTVLAEATRQATTLLGEALDVLAGVMRDPLYSATARVSAARAVLESGLRFSELITLEQRVEALEQKLGGAE